jgi:hypothetical protein
MALEPKPMRIGSGIDGPSILIFSVIGIVIGVTLWIAYGGLN